MDKQWVSYLKIAAIVFVASLVIWTKVGAESDVMKAERISPFVNKKPESIFDATRVSAQRNEQYQRQTIALLIEIRNILAEIKELERRH